MTKLTVEQANEVYNLLVHRAGAHEYYRRCFIDDLTEEEWTHEYRFMGIYGIGGKLWLGAAKGLSVDYHPENRTPELDQKMKVLTLSFLRCGHVSRKLVNNDYKQSSELETFMPYRIPHTKDNPMDNAAILKLLVPHAQFGPEVSADTWRKAEKSGVIAILPLPGVVQFFLVCSLWVVFCEL